MLTNSNCNANRPRITMAAMNTPPDPKQVWRFFGSWLQSRRKAKGRTQKEVAAAAEIHPVQYARIEGGTSGTKKETLDKVISYLELDAQETYGKAGLLPGETPAAAISLPDDSAQVITIFSRLSEDERARLLAALTALYGERAKPSAGSLLIRVPQGDDEALDEMQQRAARG